MFLRLILIILENGQIFTHNLYPNNYNEERNKNDNIEWFNWNKTKTNNQNKKFMFNFYLSSQGTSSIFSFVTRDLFDSWLMKIHRQPKFDKESEKAALERVASSRRFASVAVVALGRKLSV